MRRRRILQALFATGAWAVLPRVGRDLNSGSLGGCPRQGIAGRGLAGGRLVGSNRSIPVAAPGERPGPHLTQSSK